jgi:putative methyltransferase (TIGR04325 family)
MSQSPAMNQTESTPLKRILQVEPSKLREGFNRFPFLFSHNLAGHPLFELPRLVQLSETILNTEGHRQPRCQVARVSIDNKWSEIPAKTRIAEAIARIEEDDSWVLLYSVQTDPAYKALLDQIVTDLEELVGMPLRQEITWLDAYIFIASPHAITPYHIDHENTFLFQIQGEREVNLFDGSDRQILSDREIENYYLGDLEAADYKAENQSKAHVFHLTPGQGVHHPSLAPHCYKNGERYSIALGIHFCLRPLDLLARVYQANYYLRKLGLKPTPPGQSMMRDNLKIALIGLFSKRQPANKFELLRSGVMRLNGSLKLARRIVKWPKQMLVKIVKNIPIVSDYYYYHWEFFRRITAYSGVYRGVYRTFSEASSAIPRNYRIGFNQSVIHNDSVSKATANCEIGEFNPRDYPILFWLKSIIENDSSIFDLGGSVGLGYYSYRKYITYPDNFSWIVQDVPEVVLAGKKLASQYDSPGLSYTIEFEDIEKADILLTCGTLQYLEPSLIELLQPLAVKPKHILINRIPSYDGQTYYTLQNIGFALTPYKIQNRSEFIKSLELIGYELIDSWHDNRTCVIPFHPDRFVSGYHGFYFRQK